MLSTNAVAIMPCRSLEKLYTAVAIGVADHNVKPFKDTKSYFCKYLNRLPKIEES